MNSFDLIASIIQSLASLGWPLAVVVCVYLFREKLNEILPRLQLKHKDTEISFPLQTAIETAREDAEKLPSPPKEIAPPTKEEEDRFLTLARVSPKAAVLSAWSDFEVRLRDLVKHEPEFRSYTTSRTSPLTIMRGLRALDMVDSVTFKLFDDVRVIRNHVAHDDYPDGVNLDSAVEFAKLLERITSAIESVPSYSEQLAALGVDPQLVD